MKANQQQVSKGSNPANLHLMANVIGSLFLLTNRLQTVMDKEFAQRGLTTKQWFLMAVLSKLFPTPPKLSELSVYMGSSYQNVKKMALKLEKGGFLTLYRDEKDHRALRLALTPYFFEFWEAQEVNELDLLDTLFQKFEPSEIAQLMDYIERVSNALEQGVK